MLRWIKRKLNKGPTMFDLIDYTYRKGGKDSAFAVTMTKCGKFGDQDVIVVTAIGSSAKEIQEAYEALRGDTIATWDFSKKEKNNG